ncbi:hypothetical protein [Sphingobium aquiterrae]|uniref:hypothetical protein n=1 Tax=Sphingobium aquiterrae TaxID=2038656 RepID=UPI003016EB70
MSDTDPIPLRTLIWNIGEQRFELAVYADHAVLLTPEGQAVALANAAWTALAEAIQMVVPRPGQGGPVKATKPRKPQPSAANQGSRWTLEEDRALLHLWQEDQATIEDLMQRLGRNEGGITSRLVRLDASPDREAVRAESKRRAELASG